MSMYAIALVRVNATFNAGGRGGHRDIAQVVAEPRAKGGGRSAVPPGAGNQNVIGKVGGEGVSWSIGIKCGLRR